MNKASQSKKQGTKATGYTWVAKAGAWQVYQHFNNGSPDKLEWFNSEEEARARVNILQPEKGGVKDEQKSEEIKS